MINLKQWMELVDYRVSEGSEYCWDCFGPSTYQLSSWNGINGYGGWSFNVVFDTRSQEVYVVEVCDYSNERAYRLINPEWVDEYAFEFTRRGVAEDQAWDGVNFTDLEVDEDFIQKGTAIKAGEHYNTDITVPLSLDREEVFQLMQLAHESNLTFNEFVNKMLREYLDSMETADAL